MAAQLMDGLGSTNSEWDEHEGRMLCKGREGKGREKAGKRQAGCWVA